MHILASNAQKMFKEIQVTYILFHQLLLTPCIQTDCVKYNKCIYVFLSFHSKNEWIVHANTLHDTSIAPSQNI